MNVNSELCYAVICNQFIQSLFIETQWPFVDGVDLDQTAHKVQKIASE